MRLSTLTPFETKRGASARPHPERFTADFVLNLHDAVSSTPWHPWQPAIIRHLFSASDTVLQGSRQVVGKSYTLSWALAGAVACGLRAVIGMPTLRQSSRILLRETAQRMLDIEARTRGFRRLTKGQLEVRWSNGGGLLALSTDEAGRRGAQGYTCDLLVIDEGHTTTREQTLDIFEPLLLVARLAGHGRLVIAGVGGAKDSLIETMKAPPAAFPALTLNDVALLKYKPELASTFDRLRDTLTKDQYDQMIRCLPVAAGQRMLFGPIPELARGIGERTHLCFGVDVAKMQDQTIVAVLEVKPSFDVSEVNAVNLIAVHHIPGGMYTQQARDIIAIVNSYYDSPVLRPLGNVLVESNAMGDALADVISEFGMSDVGTNYTSAKWKAWNVDDLRAGIRHGWFGVPCDEARRELSGLTYDVDLKGNVTYEHSDILSATLLALALC